MAIKAVETTKTPAVSFFASLTKFADPVNKLSSAQAAQDPKLAARTRFVNAVEEQKKLISGASEKSRWFQKLPGGVVEIVLRNGNTAMKLGDTTFFKCANVDGAIKFLTEIQTGTKAGELDAVLTETARPPRAKKEKVAAPAPAPATDAAK